MNIDVEELSKVEGVSKALAKRVASLFVTVDALANLEPATLVATVRGMTVASATACVGYAKLAKESAKAAIDQAFEDIYDAIDRKFAK